MKNQGLTFIRFGATAIYCSKYITDHSEVMLDKFNLTTNLEKSKKISYGMPYNPNLTDIYNLSNIASEEILECSRFICR
ncbi:hypothetical protein LX77_01686 [Gelidibacter algens]|uniref:Uncharacterized protein n=1 Tax=Gelidibacter algens TaxID=49280 RepID=A0A327S6J0_9FLAO|nr:hypothetical protein LX77_01686 [Gelidibacter algens]